jgi:serine/threonine protein kinase
MDHHGVLLGRVLFGHGQSQPSIFTPSRSGSRAEAAALISLQLKSGVFREDYVAIIAKELLKGLEYLHSEGKLHRDIKGQSERLAFVDRAQADWSLHSQLPTSYSVPLVMVSMHLCFTSPSCWT